MTDSARNRAVVLGGGMAGLLVARVLAESYQDVTIVDRDDLPAAGTGHRRGVPQGRHAHLLLTRGGQALEELLPGLTGELLADGATSGDAVGEARLHFGGHRFQQGASGLRMVSVSRPFLEGYVRSRVLAMPNVSAAPPSDIAGLASTADGRRVTGAHVFRRTAGSVGETLPADLVVDATGRGSRASVWLGDLGFDRPPEEKVGAEVSYASCRYRLPPDALGNDWGCLVAPTPEHPRGGALARIEHGQWLLTVASVAGERPPTDPAGLAEFARSLPFPDIHAAMSGGEPAGDPVAYRFPGNLRRRYERLTRLPDGFLVLGDGVCSFNPIYGQGMTVAALEALALRAHLRHRRVPVPLEFQRAVARAVDTPWEMAVGGDLAFPTANGRFSPKLRMLGRYLARLHRAAAHDAALGVAFMRVSGLVDRPEALMRPSVLLRVLRGSMEGDGPTPVRNKEEDHGTSTRRPAA